MKPCSKCKVEKPLSEFRKDLRNTNGLQSQCKNCMNANAHKWRAANKKKCSSYGRQWRSDNKEKMAEYQRAYRIGRREQDNERSKKWRESNPEKTKAQTIVNHAVRAGKLSPVAEEPCLFNDCVRQAQIYHHWNGYEKANRFDVLPLCRIHHYQIHKTYPHLTQQEQ